MLALDIVLLGDKPDYRHSQNVFFSTSGFEYPKSIKQIILYAIELKENYIIEIKNALQKVKVKHIIFDLQNILEKNRKHKQMLENIIKKTD